MVRVFNAHLPEIKWTLKAALEVSDCVISKLQQIWTLSIQWAAILNAVQSMEGEGQSLWQEVSGSAG